MIDTASSCGTDSDRLKIYAMHSEKILLDREGKKILRQKQHTTNSNKHETNTETKRTQKAWHVNMGEIKNTSV